MRKYLTGVAAAALLLAGAAGASAGTISVYVAYADNLRASGFFPTPWLNSVGVVSQTPFGQSSDSAAFRVDNNSGGTITITNPNVLFPNNSSNYAIWNPLTILNGQIGIFTQTGSYNFDTSDFGQFGNLPPNALAPNNYLGNGNTSQIGGCSSSAAFIAAAGYTAACAATSPVITFSENSNPLSFTDTGHVLNTGGWDFVNNTTYGEDGNESINWNLVGTAPTRGGGVPEPATLTLLGAGLAALGFVRRRKTR